MKNNWPQLNFDRLKDTITTVQLYTQIVGKIRLVKPAEAFYSKEMGEFFLLYDDAIKATDPEKYLLDFLQTTYDAAANTRNWNRAELECDFSIYEKKQPHAFTFN